MKIVQGDAETRRRTWSLVDQLGDAIVPTSVSFVVRGTDGDTVFDEAGAGDNIAGVVDNGDGTGTWTITAGDLAVGQYEWWALATTATEVVVPRSLSGKLVITDR